MALLDDLRELPGSIRRLGDVAPPEAYAVFDCETTGTDPAVDEIVSVAVVRLDASGRELARFASLARPFGPIPAEATAVHGIADQDVASAPFFAEVVPRLLPLLEDAVFVAHNAGFDLPMLQHALSAAGVLYRPVGVACTLEAFRLVEPSAPDHRLESLCARHGIVLESAHEALSDVLATAALLRVLLDAGLAPETVRLDREAFLRLRTRGDRRPATGPQLRRVFGLARSAGLLLQDGEVDRDRVVALVQDVTGCGDPDELTREQVQDVYDALDRLIAAAPSRRAA